MIKSHKTNNNISLLRYFLKLFSTRLWLRWMSEEDFVEKKVALFGKVLKIFLNI